MAHGALTFPLSNPAARVAAPARTDAFATFRTQESTLIVLNLGVLAALALIHIGYGPSLGYPSRLALALFAGRFIEQAGELAWLRRRARPLSDATVRIYAWYSLAANILVAFLFPVLGHMHDAHDNVLMVLPVLAAAFRFGLPTTLATSAIAGALGLTAVWIASRHDPAIDEGEFFEATALAIIYFVVGLVVWLLSGHLRQQAAQLRASLDELERTRDRLIAEERLSAVGRMASAVAHEIRNPIAAIASALALGTRQHLAPDARAELDEIASREAARLAALTSDFLAYARVRPPELKHLPVLTTLQYVVTLMKARAAESSLHLVIDCPADLQATMDPFQVHQVLLNLVLNAIEAAPPGSTIRLGGSCIDPPRDTAAICIFVENTGASIEPQAAAHIFEPFFTTKDHGSGLGLSIARSIALAHRGDLRLAANVPNCVRFELLLPDAPSVSAQEPQLLAASS